MGRNTPAPAPSNTIVSTPIGGISPVFRSGDAYKSIGELVQRSVYTALSLAYPRNGSSYGSSSLMNDTAQSWSACAFGNGIVVAVAKSLGGAVTSQAGFSVDFGKTWNTSTLPAAHNWSGITYGAGLFVAIASDSTSCATSPDGFTWTLRTVGITSDCIAFGAGVFIALKSGSTNAASSPDGITWTARTLPTSSAWSAVIFGGTKFCAVSSGSVNAATSTDGLTWAAQVLPSSSTWSAIDYGAGLFVVVGGSSFITSPDGVTWTTRVTPLGSTSCHAIVFGNGVFVAPFPTAGICLVSFDGISWVIRSMISANNWRLCCYGVGNFVVIAGKSADSSAACTFYVENMTDSDYLYLSGTSGQFVRVK